MFQRSQQFAPRTRSTSSLAPLKSLVQAISNGARLDVGGARGADFWLFENARKHAKSAKSQAFWHGTFIFTGREILGGLSPFNSSVHHSGNPIYRTSIPILPQLPRIPARNIVHARIEWTLKNDKIRKIKHIAKQIQPNMIAKQLKTTENITHI